jgi:hypothetical protein
MIQPTRNRPDRGGHGMTARPWPLFFQEKHIVTDRLQTLFDKEDIRELRTLYSHLLDTHDMASLDRVFARDAVLEVSVGVMRGLDAIRAGLSEAFALFDRDKEGIYPFLHAVTNHWIVLTGPDTAQGRCYLLDFETATRPDANPLLLLGLYADDYRRIDGHWRITGSRLEMVWPQRNAPLGGVPGKGMRVSSEGISRDA